MSHPLRARAPARDEDGGGMRIAKILPNVLVVGAPRVKAPSYTLWSLRQAPAIIHRMRQLRTSFLSRGHMTFRIALALTGLALAGTVVSGAHGGASGKAFTSARYHYSITVPPRWKIMPAVSDPLPGQFPAADGGETDKFISPVTKPTPTEIGVAAEKLRSGTTLQAWTRRQIAELQVGYGCPTNPARRTRSLAGQTTNELIYTTCTGSYFIVLATVHHGRGYDVLWVSPWTRDGSTYAADRAAFDRVLAAFRFT
jgi:hypothetical protein